MAFHKIMVTGADGMFGRELVLYLKAKGYQVMEMTRMSLDLLHSEEDLRCVIASYEPEIIVHAAAYTNVDAAENASELAMAVNRDGTRKIANICRDLGCIMVYISTDFVFDGLKTESYRVDDRPNPISVYGLSKYYGELAIKEALDTYYIIRTSWLYGIHGYNFVEFVLNSAKQGKEMTIVDDWRGGPTWTGSLAHLTESVMISGAFGTYHAVDSGNVSKYEQARIICQSAGLSCETVVPVSYKTLSFAAKRPPYSVLHSEGLSVPSWESSLQAYLVQYSEKSLL